MIRFVRHEPCPACGSRDNLGVWEDGHKWCFGCHHYVPADNKNSIEALTKQVAGQGTENNNNNKRSDDPVDITASLPDDFVYSFPEAVEFYLKQYGLTTSEIYGGHFRWSPGESRLYTMVFSPFGYPVFAQGRAIGKPVGEKSIRTIGSFRGVLASCGPDSDRVCLVEDPVSWVKIGRYVKSVCLFGSHISNDLVLQIRDILKPKVLILWLDQDKAKYALKRREELRSLFPAVQVIISREDPKSNLHGDIMRFLEV